MKFKITPLLIASTALIIYGVYSLCFNDPGEEGWGTLAAVIFVVGGIVALAINRILSYVLRNKVTTQIFVETAFSLS